MADISQYLQAILSAVYGEDVRGSIHDAIKIINDVSEVVLSIGTAVDSASSSSTGFYEDSLYLNSDTYELWKCVGTDSWSSQGILKGDTGAAGADGNRWFRGTGISGKAVNPTVYSGSGITDAHVNDFYLNPVEAAVYHCVSAGDASTATWSYDFTMSGGGGGGDIVTWTQIQTSTGATKIAEIDINGTTTDVYAPSGGGGGGLSNAFDEVVVGVTTIAASGGDTLTLSAGTNITLTPNAGTKTVEIAASAGGHTMTPTPNASLSDDDIVDAINTPQNGSNTNVVSAYSVQRWSNTFEKTYLLQASQANPFDANGIGTWFDGDVSQLTPQDEADWWYIDDIKKVKISENPDVYYDILADDSIEFKWTHDPAKSKDPKKGGYIIDSDTGYVCLKFADPLSAAECETACIGLTLTHKRNEVTVLPLQPSP